MAIIRPHKLSDVHDRLRAIGIPGMTVTRVVGCSTSHGVAQVFRGARYVSHETALLQLEIVADDGQAPAVARAIAQFANTGERGDGILFVTRVEDAFRVRSGERGDAAL